ncbi:MAG TPA: hypothetical protein VKA53_05035, partial [Thermoanaerobaculia bacterium]|nr:hypothetical protein [Thermoanaerobaculia bacterium]
PHDRAQGLALVSWARGDAHGIEEHLRDLPPSYFDVMMLARAGFARQAEAALGKPSEVASSGAYASADVYHAALSHLALVRGKTPGAVDSLERAATALRGEDSSFYFMTVEALADAHEALGDQAAALAALEVASRERPNLPEPFLGAFWIRTEAHRARLLRRMGRVPEAEKVEADLRVLLALADPDVAGLAGTIASERRKPVTGSRPIGSVRVDARANVFGASPGKPGDGEPPTTVRLPAGSDRTILLQNVSGQVRCCSGCAANGPEGGSDYGSTHVVSSQAGISDAVHASATMYLAAVFEGDGPPAGPKPVPLEYPGPDSKPELRPSLNQVFFVGDGLTGKGRGEPQRLVVPDGATRLLLGFVDGLSFSGPASMYADNSGEITLDVSVAERQSAPRPRPSFE